jgi:hypothetical protein
VVPQVAWWQRFQQLVNYKQDHGDCKVPKRYNVNPSLGEWVVSQRDMKRNATLSVEREAQLDSIGFFWGKNASTMKRKTCRPLITRRRKGNA